MEHGSSHKLRNLSKFVKVIQRKLQTFQRTRCNSSYACLFRLWSTDDLRLIVPRQQSEHSVWPLRMSGTRCRSTFAILTLCRLFVTNSIHTFSRQRTHDETYTHHSAPVSYLVPRHTPQRSTKWFYVLCLCFSYVRILIHFWLPVL